MRINFTNIQVNQEKEIPKAQTAEKKDTKAAAVFAANPFSATQTKQGIYDKQGKTMEDIQTETSVVDTASLKDYMTVMANTMSADDYQALVKDGINPGRIEAGDAVTIMDHIKAEMAKAGTVITGFNSSDDFSLDKLTALSGDAGYAQSLMAAFSQNDIPLTEDNARETVDAKDLAMQIGDVTDDMKQYLLENELPVTIENTYKAKFAATYQGQEKDQAMAADPAFAKQIDSVIEEAGLTADEQTKADCMWLVGRDIPLTAENLLLLQDMNRMEQGNEAAVTEKIVEALKEGKAPKEALLAGESLLKKAEKIMDEAVSISDEAVDKVVSEGQTCNIHNLARAQADLEMQQKEASVSSGNMTETDAQLSGQQIHARRVMEEVRLQMTVRANLLLLQSDYAIDTQPIEDLVENLKKIEQQSGETMGISLPDEAMDAVWKENSHKIMQIGQMPAAILGPIGRQIGSYQLSGIYEAGLSRQSMYQKAGESYEALMTQPRADLGDSIKDAFRNVDDLLSENGMEATDANRRAVRILAYNRQEITKENIEEIRYADAKLQNLLSEMTPAKTLQMIREGVNPLEETVDDLTAYLQNQQTDYVDNEERFSRYLYKLEQEKSISAEERASYIGIYRLIRQIEKGDGKAIGTVVANGQELSFSNLLSAVRTGQKKKVDVKVDDDFGLQKEVVQKGESISDQIDSYYQYQAKGLFDALSMETVQTEMESISIMQSGEELAKMREDLTGQEPVIEFLTAFGQPVHAQNMAAAKQMLNSRGDMFRKIKDAESETENADTFPNVDAAFEELLSHFNDVEEAKQSYKDFTDTMQEAVEEAVYEQSDLLDIKALSLVAKQLCLSSHLAKEECYEMPAVIRGELTSVTVRFRHTEQKEASASLQVTLTDGEIIAAKCRQENGRITGYIGCNREDTLQKLQEKEEDFKQSVLSETGYSADITIVYSQDIKNSYYDTEQSAGKQMHTNTENRSEEVQGSHTSANGLYQTAKQLIRLLMEI
ncbi:hypothetical protein KQI22_03035 [Kineothrix sp. MSJ-39]|uniref:DUF6240 domain-containing protein n=1 Tax=Kineothrix sp. MSJ-39 TaxID=2841533 RepID=UPI001C10A53D|nr:DUF6240 domain-containing protein [Kineothrix sp. MSJ-39]MBU5429043.1 hypothetical protein [Kineothrix sp. MSJ-39]